MQGQGKLGLKLSFPTNLLQVDALSTSIGPCKYFHFPMFFSKISIVHNKLIYTHFLKRMPKIRKLKNNSVIVSVNHFSLQFKYK